MKNNRGWIKLSRESLTSSVRLNPEIWTIWTWMLMKANHEDVTFPFNGEDATVKKGAFISGYLSAKSENSWLTPRKWRTICTYLKTTGRVTVQATNRYSIITILNYSEYQSDDSPTDKRATVKRQSSDSLGTTNKNDKELKELKNDKNIEVVGNISPLIKLFEYVNPNYKRLYSNVTERAALERMVKEHGEQRMIEIISHLHQIVCQPYAPQITTPYELEKKMGKLMLFMQQKRNEVNKFTITKV